MAVGEEGKVSNSGEGGAERRGRSEAEVREVGPSPSLTGALRDYSK
jgi:hypothetical protein